MKLKYTSFMMNIAALFPYLACVDKDFIARDVFNYVKNEVPNHSRHVLVRIDIHVKIQEVRKWLSQYEGVE